MIIENLFTTKQWRELELIALLTKSPKPMYYKDVCEQLECSLLTLQSCVDNPIFIEGIGKITYEYSQLHIDYKHEYGLKEVYQRAIKESQSLQLMSLLFFDDFETLAEVADELFVSISTLKRLITKTNSYLKRAFNIEITANPPQVIGKEYDIRLFYLKYFSEAYTLWEWPFESIVNERNLGRLIKIMVDLTDIGLNFSIFHHIKILGAVNLIRYSKGHSVGEYKELSGVFLSLLKDSREMKDISRLFFVKYGLFLDEMALSEIFSNYLSGELFLGKCLESDNHTSEDKPEIRCLSSWIKVLDDIEDDTQLMQPNKYEIAVALHTTVILGEEDVNRNFLLCNNAKCYLAFFKQYYRAAYDKIRSYIIQLFERSKCLLDKGLLENLIYTMLITWENLFSAIGKTLPKTRVLVIEKSQGSVGSFLRDYIGDYFEVTVFTDLILEKHTLQTDYDVIVTDTVIDPRNFKNSDVFYFSQLVPTAVTAKLNQYLRAKMGGVIL
ncbi:helix-turn-helix domain-containing protein [Streptococcus dysgalactiae]|uniref:helix-turn-helix domain-containing protein n=1 Tax=Streptococcus dysgalactiae TaxID=1334 RepID=UPI0010CAC9B3|nr:helix-turn-helix domain-containing protein [Streptococcus dysgalactiae]VTT09309.1 Mga-like regulatory protein [Streptococcus dysgalactiae]